MSCKNNKIWTTITRDRAKVLIVPLLTLAFGLPIYFAIGASIISVIATSSGAAAAYVRDHLTNLRIGMFLEIATTTGAITGAFLAGLLAPNLLFVLFGVILLLSALPQVFKISEELPQGVKNDRLANWLRLSSTYPDQHLERDVTYQVTRTPLLMFRVIYQLARSVRYTGCGRESFCSTDRASFQPTWAESPVSSAVNLHQPSVANRF